MIDPLPPYYRITRRGKDRWEVVDPGLTIIGHSATLEGAIRLVNGRNDLARQPKPVLVDLSELR